MADTPQEGKLTCFLDFTQVVDMASETIGGKASRVPAAMAGNRQSGLAGIRLQQCTLRKLILPQGLSQSIFLFLFWYQELNS